MVAQAGLGAIRIVDANGSGDFTTIQDAIEAAEHFDTVVVRPGLYYERIRFNGTIVAVTSEDPNGNKITILDGGGSGEVVTFANSEVEPAGLRGFTIRNGETGVFCRGKDTSPLIENCLITTNETGVRGEDMPNPTIANCVVENNFSSGISKCSGLIRASVIQKNGGVGIAECHSEVVSSEIRGNEGGGFLRQFGDVRNCLIVGNQGHGYALYEDGSEVMPMASYARVVNCTIVGNSSDGVYLKGTTENGAHPVLQNCILAYNGGCGVYAWNKNPKKVEIGYSCLWGNSKDGLRADNDQILIVTDCLEDDRPWFVDSGYWNDGTWVEGDYHLMSTVGTWDPSQGWVQYPRNSPCLDRGDPSMATGDEPLPNGGVVNMGAYGGTLEASMSGGPVPICTEFPEMDFNRDCKVDLVDLGIFLEHWLECNLDPNGAGSTVAEHVD